MGGYGSGRWGSGKSDAKTLVEACHALDSVLLYREGIIRADTHLLASWEWLDRDRGKAVASIGLEVQTESDSGTVLLQYRIRKSGGEPYTLDYPIPLLTSRLPSGGLRWWFRCMASCNDGPSCRKRVRVLYLPPHERFFACRSCHKLAYESSRESRKYTSVFNTIGADMGIDGRMVKKILDLRFDPEIRARAEGRQRGRIDRILSADTPQEVYPPVDGELYVAHGPFAAPSHRIF